FPWSSELSSSLALSCALLVIAPKRAQVVPCNAFTVRSGSALPSLHQNSQPMSQGAYSASNFIRSRTIRVASITSFPTPSPGIHAILYLAIGRRLYRSGRDWEGCGHKFRFRSCIAWYLLGCSHGPVARLTLAHCRSCANGPQGRGYNSYARRRLATRFSAPPATINSCAAGLSGGNENDFPSTVRIDFA